MLFTTFLLLPPYLLCTNGGRFLDLLFLDLCGPGLLFGLPLSSNSSSSGRRDLDLDSNRRGDGDDFAVGLGLGNGHRGGGVDGLGDGHGHGGGGSDRSRRGGRNGNGRGGEGSGNDPGLLRCKSTRWLREPSPGGWCSDSHRVGVGLVANERGRGGRKTCGEARNRLLHPSSRSARRGRGEAAIGHPRVYSLLRRSGVVGLLKGLELRDELV